MNMNSPPQSVAELPAVIPVFPLPGVLLLPGAQLPLNIFEPRYVSMVDDALRSSRIIGMIQPADTHSDAQNSHGLRPVGCAGKITQFGETGDGRYLITLSGAARFRIVDEVTTTTSYRQCQVDFSEYADDLEQFDDSSIDRAKVINALKQFTSIRNMRIDWSDIDKASNTLLINAMSMMSPFGPNEKQALLEAPDVETRSNTLVTIIEIEIAGAKNISTKLQ